MSALTAPRELLLLGCGGFAREAAGAVRALRGSGVPWRLRGFLDDRQEMHGTWVLGAPVLGPIASALDHPDAVLVITTGRPDNYTSRRLIHDRLGLGPERFATIVHPTATIGPSCRVGHGSALLAHVDLTADAVVGAHVMVMPQVVLPHDSLTEDFATLASGVRLGGGTRVGAGAYLGAGSCIREGVEIGERAMVGMGSVVTEDVPAERLWYGNPAQDAGPAPLPGRVVGEAA